MNKFTRIFLLAVIFTGQMFVSFADRGAGKKKSKININIKPAASFNSSLNFNLRNGMTYKGSMSTASVSSSQFSTTLITYQKGNNVYVVPYKQKVIVSDARQGYAGAKLIIRVP